VKRRMMLIIGACTLLVSLTFASACHLKPGDVCEIYKPTTGDVDIYHWHTFHFTWDGRVYEGGYHCEMIVAANGVRITYCIGEKGTGDTDQLPNCDYLH